MADSSQTIEIPADSAVAVTDGGVGRRGAGCGMAFIHAGSVRLQGRPLPGVEESWDAEVAGVRMALDRALSLGVSRLRLLIDHHELAMFVQGYRPYVMSEKHVEIERAMAEATDAGLMVSVRQVQGHAETMDLPSRLNDLAHITSDRSVRDPLEVDLPFEPGWIDRLVQEDIGFKPTRTHQRWAAQLPRRRAAHFLGFDAETVDLLVRGGHLTIGHEGVHRRSAAAVYVAAQNLRLDAYFGFDAPEGRHGRWEDEIARGWDGRPAKWYHRKSGIRAPVEGTPELSEVVEETEEMASAPGM